MSEIYMKHGDSICTRENKRWIKLTGSKIAKTMLSSMKFIENTRKGRDRHGQFGMGFRV